VTQVQRTAAIGRKRPKVAAVTREDRRRWDERYVSQERPPIGAVAPPGVFAAYAEIFPTTGRALDLACGQGLGAVWLARRGLEVLGLDISPIAIGRAWDLAQRSGVGDRCRFDVFDFDDGLPAGPPVDVIQCHKFRDRRLDQAIIERLAPGGLLAIAALSEVDAAPGPFRAAPGELPAAFAELDLVAAGEGQGYAWLLARA
jgi:SAM-dependent methyltransferase